MADALAKALRRLPAVDALLGTDSFRPLVARHGHAVVVEAIQADLAGLRQAIRSGDVRDPEDRLEAQACAQRVDRWLSLRARPAYARAINATGVVLHTGLGRAPLAAAAERAIVSCSRYTVLEVDRDSGRRGQRDTGISALVSELTGGEDACVVNNNAGATLIALAALAPDRPVIVSRGQLVEIGGSFRIPDVMAASGARMIEVGSTNRTHLRDYAQALEKHPETALLLRVHTSNFRVMGFTHEVPLSELVALAREHRIEVMDDLGSGCLVEMEPYGLPREPLVQESLATGAGVVTFSGDKLLGGPQAGILVGNRELIASIRRHPLYRALRPDKLVLAALEATLALYRRPDLLTTQLPVLEMISQSADRLSQRASALAERIRVAIPRADVRVAPSTSRIGGGSYAVEELPTHVVALRPSGESPSVDLLAQQLRQEDPCVFVRIQDGRLVIDPRTLTADEERELVHALKRVF